MLAYIDPGAGSLIFQMLIAGLMGMTFLFRKTFIAPLRYLTRLVKRQKNQSND